MPDRMPEDMPEDMSDRMPEDLPVTKHIDVMVIIVGITRSKVILFCQHASDLQQVDTLPDNNIEIPLEKEEVLCVLIADFGQINAVFFSKQDMCLSETDTDMSEIATNEARVMSTKNEACNDQLLPVPGSPKKKKTCGIPAAFECWCAGKQNRRPPRRPVMIRHVMLLPKSKAAKAAG